MSEAAPLVVRAARPHEFDDVGALTLLAYDGAGILGTDPGYRSALLDAASRADGSELLVAELDGVVVGTVTYCPFGTEHAEISRSDEAEFRMLGVDPQRTGLGIGRALVAACEERARADGCARLVLSVIDHNDRAAALYAHLGFSRVPERDWRPAPGTLLLVWEKPLAPATPWCARCGLPRAGGDHASCVQALALEPPRYCASCRRRMVVQVLPAGWTASCVEHGTLTGP